MFGRDGHDGNDKLYGENGSDNVRGGNGNDRLMGGKGADKLEGGRGNDWVSYADATAQLDKNGNSTSKGVTVDLSKASRNLGDTAKGDTFGSIENVKGSFLDDEIVGNDSVNVLFGNGGIDSLTGGKGKDVFVFNTTTFSFSEGTKVTDFHGGDVLWLDDDVFLGIAKTANRDKEGTASINSKVFWASDEGLAHKKTDRLLFDKTDGTLWYDSDGTGSAQRSLIVTLHDNDGLLHTLSASSIRVVETDFLA